MQLDIKLDYDFTCSQGILYIQKLQFIQSMGVIIPRSYYTLILVLLKQVLFLVFIVVSIVAVTS